MFAEKTFGTSAKESAFSRPMLPEILNFPMHFMNVEPEAAEQGGLGV